MQCCKNDVVSIIPFQNDDIIYRYYMFRQKNNKISLHELLFIYFYTKKKRLVEIYLLCSFVDHKRPGDLRPLY